MRSLPLLLAHFVVVGCFALRSDAAVRWHVSHLAAMAVGVYSAVLLLVDLGWQNTATRHLDTRFEGLVFVTWTESSGANARAALILVRAVSLCVAIWVARRLHGKFALLTHAPRHSAHTATAGMCEEC